MSVTCHLSAKAGVAPQGPTDRTELPELRVMLEGMFHIWLSWGNCVFTVYYHNTLPVCPSPPGIRRLTCKARVLAFMEISQVVVSNQPGSESINIHQKRSSGANLCGMFHLDSTLSPWPVAKLFVSLKITNESQAWWYMPMIPALGGGERRLS